MSVTRLSLLHISVLEKCVKKGGKDLKEFEEDLRINVMADAKNLGHSAFSHDRGLDETLKQDGTDIKLHHPFVESLFIS